MLDGKKNYLFGAAFIVAGVIDFFAPELQVSVGGIDTPQEMIAAGVAWVLGRNAIKKLEA